MLLPQRSVRMDGMSFGKKIHRSQGVRNYWFIFFFRRFFNFRSSVNFRFPVCARCLRTDPFPMKSVWRLWRTSWRRPGSWLKRLTANTTRSVQEELAHHPQPACDDVLFTPCTFREIILYFLPLPADDQPFFFLDSPGFFCSQYLPY